MSFQTSYTGESVKPRSFGILKGVLLDTSIISSAKRPVWQSLQRRVCYQPLSLKAWFIMWN